ncbi:hypothetical protein M2T91_25710, partial [Klebsiella pneumoniae]|nr:hypothetical protein [Klebsiella pneumoniae]
TTASFVSGEYFGLAIKLHLTQLGVQLLGCSPAAPPGKLYRTPFPSLCRMTANALSGLPSPQL